MFKTVPASASMPNQEAFEGSTPSGWRWVILAGCVLGLVSVYLSMTTTWREALRRSASVANVAPAAPTPAPALATIPATQPTTSPAIAVSAVVPSSATRPATTASPTTQPAMASRPPQPGPNYIWVEGYRRGDGTIVKGYWRRK